MKSIIKFQSYLVGLIVIFFSTFSFSQNDLSRLANQSQVIIEGKVTHQEFFKSPTNGHIFTKNIVSIRKVFKGNLPENQLTIITKGGTLNGVHHSWSHNFTLSTDENGVFFLMPNKIDNEAFEVVEGINGFIGFRNYRTSSLKGYAPNQIYENLERNIFKPLEIITQQRTIVSFNDYEKELFEGGLMLSSNECVEYKISNLQILVSNSFVGSTSYFLEFDIEVKALQDAFDIQKTELRMEYSTSLLGENIVANNYISVAKGSDFADYQMTLYDEASNKIGVDIEKTTNATALEINSFYTNLYHAVIEIQNFDMNAILQLTVDENIDLTTFKEDGGNITEITCNEFNENVNITVNQLIPPVITSWTTDVTAGTRTILTITGDNFGTSQFDSEVWFTNAYNHSVAEWIKPYSGDYDSWSNTEIKVYVPTYAQSASVGGPFGANRNYAGSGLFRVVKFDGFDEKDLTVTYAATNDIRNSMSQPIFLTKKNSADGYTVTYTDAFKSKTDGSGNKFTDAFERALNTWCMETGLNYTLDVGAYPNGTWDVLVDIQDDPMSFNTPASTLTPRYDTNCNVTINNGSSNHPETFESDFIESSTITFWDDPLNGLWDAGTISSSSHNVEKVSLHELGHAHGILHTNHLGELMYFSAASVSSITSEATSASNYLQDHSENHNCQNGNYKRQTSCTTGTHDFPNGQFINLHLSGGYIIIQNPNEIILKKISLFTSDGILVGTFKSTKERETLIPLPLQLPSGIYFLTVDSEDGRITDKFSITK